MKTADIKVGEDYALAASWQRNYRRDGVPTARRFTVLEKGVALRERYDTKNNGVRGTEHYPGRPDAARIVPSREIWVTWAEFEALVETAQARIDAAAKHRDETGEALFQKYSLVLPTGFDLSRFDPRLCRRPTATHEEVIKLLNAAYSQGRADQATLESL